MTTPQHAHGYPAPSHPPVDDELFDLREKAAEAWDEYSKACDRWENGDAFLSEVNNLENVALRYDRLAAGRFRELNAPATIALGNVLLDPDAPAETVNAALSEWRRAEGYDDDPGDCTCGNGVTDGNGCPVCRAELETGEIPFQI